eukprot:1156272-Pelagomonas_calceolata.AAC.8
MHAWPNVSHCRGPGDQWRISAGNPGASAEDLVTSGASVLETLERLQLTRGIQGDNKRSTAQCPG